MNSIKTILSLVVVEDFHLDQLDVKLSFLHGDLEEEILLVKLCVIIPTLNYQSGTRKL